jgi:uncharacterized protein
MADEACPLPSANRRGDTDRDAIRRMLRGHRIAVVGLSQDRSRAAWMIASYLISIGKQVVPVNPHFDELMALTCYPTVSSIPEKVDVVDVFRRAEFCPEVVRDAVKSGAAGVWLQSGIVSREARQIAESANIDFVENRCLMVELMHASH